MKKIFLLLLIFVLFFVTRSVAQCHCGSGGGFSFSASPGELTTMVSSSAKWLGDVRYTYLALKPAAATYTETNTAQPSLMQQVMPALGFRLSEKFSFSAALPFYSIHTTQAAITSMGDAQVAGHFTWKPHLRLPAQLRFTAGAKLPTGHTGTMASNGIVTGTGSVDMLTGVQLQLQHHKLVYRYTGQFRYAGKGYEEIRFGNSVLQQAGIYFVPAAAICETDSLLRKKVRFGFSSDVTWEWQQMQSKGIAYIENSGQQNLWLGAGFFMQYRAFTLPLGIELPVYHAHNGSQAAPQFRIRAGVSVKIH